MRAGSHEVPSPYPQTSWSKSLHSQPWRVWKLGLTTSHGVPSPKSQVCHKCLHGNSFGRQGLGLVLRAGLSKKLDPTLNVSPANISPYYNQELTLMVINHILMTSWDSKVWTSPPCWDLRLGTPCEPATSILTFGLHFYLILSGALSCLQTSKPSPEISGSVLDTCRMEKARMAPLVIQPKHKGHGSVGQLPNLWYDTNHTSQSPVRNRTHASVPSKLHTCLEVLCFDGPLAKGFQVNARGKTDHHTTV